MKKHTYWIITILALFFIGVGIGINVYLFQSPPPTPIITFTPPNIWELCQQAYSAPHPIPSEFFPKEFREYWTQNHFFYLVVGGINDLYKCTLEKEYGGLFKVSVTKKEK